MTKKIICVVMALVVSMLAAFGGVIGAHAEKEDVPVVAAKSVFADAVADAVADAYSDAYAAAIDDVGLFGFKYDKADKVFYSANNAWQRNFGYNKYYDIFARLFFMFYDTVRIRFNYNDRDWLIQFWKGQYGLVLMGSEVGVYWKEPGTDSIQYHCVKDEERIKMGYTIYSHDDVLYVRTYQPSWWLTGFVGGKLDKFSDRSQLRMSLRMTFDDKGMLNAFVEALKNPLCGFRVGDGQEDDTFMVSGNDVYIMWHENRDVQTRDLY